MSRAGTRKLDANAIPQQPEIVTDVASQLLEQRAMNLYGQLSFKLGGAIIPHPAIHGALIAENVMGQIMQQMIVAQSRIVVPTPQIERISA